MAMAKRNIDSGRVVNGNKGRSTSKFSNSKSNTSPPRTNNKNKGEQQPHLQKRLSPVRVNSQSSPPGSLGSSPRTSPGLLAGHYAGCKFSEPPLPSALPLPPRHWVQSPSGHSVPFIPFLAAKPSHQQIDIAQQLKMMLNVPA